MSRLKLFIPLLIFLVLAAFLFRGLDLNPQAMPSALIDRQVPEFSLSKLYDLEIQVGKEALPGEVFLLNVWATWCVSCRVEHPHLMAIAEQEGLSIVGLNYKDDAAAAKKWLVDYGNPYRFNLYDPDGSLGLDLGVFGAPETYLIGADGVIRYKHVGVVDWRVWEEVLKPLVTQLAQSSANENDASQSKASQSKVQAL